MDIQLVFEPVENAQKFCQRLGYARSRSVLIKDREFPPRALRFFDPADGVGGGDYLAEVIIIFFLLFWANIYKRAGEELFFVVHKFIY